MELAWTHCEQSKCQQNVNSVAKQALEWTLQRQRRWGGRPSNTWRRDLESEMRSAGFKHRWRKVEAAAQDRTGWRKVVCGRWTTGSDKAYISPLSQTQKPEESDERHSTASVPLLLFDEDYDARYKHFYSFPSNLSCIYRSGRDSAVKAADFHPANLPGCNSCWNPCESLEASEGYPVKLLPNLCSRRTHGVKIIFGCSAAARTHS